VQATPKIATKDVNDIFQAVGASLSAWEFLEHQIAMLFSLLVSEIPPPQPLNDFTPAVRAYGSIVSFQARAGMVEAAARAYFHLHPHDEFEQWYKDLMKAANGWSARRNDVAHGTVNGCPWDSNLCLLWPSDYNTKKYSLERLPAYLYNHIQIKEFTDQFYDLNTEFTKFYCALHDWRSDRG
jgi:hypothetical protein